MGTLRDGSRPIDRDWLFIGWWTFFAVVAMAAFVVAA